MQVAAVQLEPAIGDVAANLTAAERIAAEAARAGTERIMLPEFFTDSDAFQPPLVQRATLALDAA
jgi:predicted amidohydrolase